MKRYLDAWEKDQMAFLVAGDVMLDRYLIGEIPGISPEAPVPIFKKSKHYAVPGGAGNVAKNLAGLNSRVVLCALGQEDSAGNELRVLLDSENIDHLLIASEKRPTTEKTRIVCSRQQLMRMDTEVNRALSEQETLNISAAITQIIEENQFQGILISDYNKGFCHEMICRLLIDQAKKQGIPVLVDPKDRDWSKYQGATMITPNLKEFSQAINVHLENKDEVIEKAARTAIKKWDFDNILITRSEKGMTLITKDENIVHFPAEGKEIFDVSGAGDTVAALCLQVLASKGTPSEAAAIANRAAAEVVSHWGTYPIQLTDLQNSLRQGLAALNESLVEAEEMLQIKKKKGKQGMKMVFTNGCFDLLHPGHVEYLHQAKDLGDYLVVGLNSDASIKRIKGADRPVNKEYHRAMMLLALKAVDYVIIFEDDTPLELIKSLSPSILVKGGDYKEDEIVGREYAGQTLTLPFLEGFSSSSIIERIRK